MSIAYEQLGEGPDLIIVSGDMTSPDDIARPNY